MLRFLRRNTSEEDLIPLPNSINENFKLIETYKTNIAELAASLNENARDNREIFAKIEAVKEYSLNAVNSLNNFIMPYLLKNNRQAQDLHAKLWNISIEIQNIAIDAKKIALKTKKFELSDENICMLSFKQGSMTDTKNLFIDTTLNELKLRLIDPDSQLATQDIEPVLNKTKEIIEQAFFDGENSLSQMQFNGMRNHYYQLMESYETLHTQMEQQIEINRRLQEQCAMLEQDNAQLTQNTALLNDESRKLSSVINNQQLQHQEDLKIINQLLQNNSILNKKLDNLNSVQTTVPVTNVPTAKNSTASVNPFNFKFSAEEDILEVFDRSIQELS